MKAIITGTVQEIDQLLERGIQNTMNRLGLDCEFEPTPNGRWRANKGGIYWYSDELGVARPAVDAHSEWDEARYAAGNYYQHPATARAMGEQIRMVMARGA